MGQKVRGGGGGQRLCLRDQSLRPWASDWGPESQREAEAFCQGPGARGQGPGGQGARGPGARGQGPGGQGPRGPGARGQGARGPGGQGPGARGPGARGQGPGARGQGPGARGLGPGAWGLGPGARDQGSTNERALVTVSEIWKTMCEFGSGLGVLPPFLGGSQ